MKANIVDILPPIPYLAKFWFSSYGQKCRKAGGMKLIFCLQINKRFLQIDSIPLGLHSQACPKYPKQV